MKEGIVSDFAAPVSPTDPTQPSDASAPAGDIDLHGPDWFAQAYMAPDAFDEDKLDPELNPWVGEATLGRMLRHPLIYALPPIAWRWANAYYHQKLASLAVALTKREWGKAIGLHERPWRLTRLDEYWTSIEDPIERNAILLWVWSDTEQPHQFGDVPLRLFTAARADRPSYLTDDDAGDHPLLPAGRALTVFRGTGVRERPGIAWTLDREKAIWFANRYRDAEKAVLITGTVRTSDVLAYIVGRGESEIVVDPRKVRHQARERVSRLARP